jgi:hypothetical protein
MGRAQPATGNRNEIKTGHDLTSQRLGQQSSPLRPPSARAARSEDALCSSVRQGTGANVTSFGSVSFRLTASPTRSMGVLAGGPGFEPRLTESESLTTA